MCNLGRISPWLLYLTAVVFPRYTESFAVVVPATTNSRTSSSFTSHKPLYNSNSDDEEEPKKIVIVGGGFGGIHTALTLSSLPWKTPPKITLLDRKERFVFLPLLYELCVGDADLDEVAPTFKSLLENVKDVEFVQTEVVGVDVREKGVYVVNDDTIMDYDALVVASGMQCAAPSDLALPFYTLENCYELRRRLALLDTYDGDKLQAVVVGGGYSGVELAANLMERLGGKNKASVTLIHRGSEILEGASDFHRRNSVTRLKDAGITLLTDTGVTDIQPASKDGQRYDCTVHTTSTTTLNTNLLLWTAGAKPPPNMGVLNSILPRDTRHRIVCDSTLRVRDTPNVFCLGDASRCRKEAYAANAQVAMQQANVVAYNIYVTLEDKLDSKLLPFRFTDLGSMMTLGSDDATISSLNGAVEFKGPAASVARRLVYAARMPTAAQAARAAVLSTKQRLTKNT